MNKMDQHPLKLQRMSVDFTEEFRIVVLIDLWMLLPMGVEMRSGYWIKYLTI